MSSPSHAVVGALIALAAPAIDPQNACKQAADRFAATKAQVEAAVQDHAKCVASAAGMSARSSFEMEMEQGRLEAADPGCLRGPNIRRVCQAGQMVVFNGQAIRPRSANR